jgi:hypothetical protein
MAEMFDGVAAQNTVSWGRKRPQWRSSRRPLDCLRHKTGNEIPNARRANRSRSCEPRQFAPSAGYHQGITSGTHGPARPGPRVPVAPKLKHLDRIRPNCTDSLHVRFPLALPIPQTPTGTRASRGITRVDTVFFPKCLSISPRCAASKIIP